MDLFSVASWPYLPSNLRHLRPPVPNDLPPDQDSTVFAFEDAFEDLMTVAQGGPLPEINTRCSQRQLLRQMYPDGEPTWFWLRRLESQGLLARHPVINGMRALSDDDHGHYHDDLGLLGRHLESAFSRLHWPDWEEFHDQLARRAQDVWRHDRKAADIEHDGQTSQRKYPSDSEVGFPQSDPSQNRHHSQRQGLFPDNFDDLFSSIISGFAEGQKSWDTFVKSILDSNNKQPRPADENGQQKTRQDDHEPFPRDKEVVTRDEHVDQFGYLHTTVVRKSYDKHGNEIGSQTHFTMRPAEKELALDNKGLQKENDNEKKNGNAIESKTDADGDAIVINRANRDADDQPKSDKKPGWFWN